MRDVKFLAFAPQDESATFVEARPSLVEVILRFLSTEVPFSPKSGIIEKETFELANVKNYFDVSLSYSLWKLVALSFW